MSLVKFGGSGVQNFASKRYPEDVGTTEVPNYITFRPAKINFKKVKDYGNAFSKTIEFPGTTNSSDKTTATVSNNVLSQFNASFNFKKTFNFNISGVLPQLLGSVSLMLKGGLSIGNVDQKSGVSQERATLTSQGMIALYMPPGIASSTSADYKTSEIGATGARAAQAVREKEYSSVEAATAAATDSIPAVLSDLSRTFFKDTFSVATGRVSNQFTYAIFNGVKHREFNYKFKMVAKDQNESIEIKQICDLFMYHMLPEKTTSTDFHFYEIPNQWFISYKRLGDNIPYLDSPRPCFLKDVKISYGGETNMALHNDGAPIDVTLDLTFTEIEPLYRDGGNIISNAQAGLGVMAPVFDKSGGPQ